MACPAAEWGADGRLRANAHEEIQAAMAGACERLKAVHDGHIAGLVVAMTKLEAQAEFLNAENASLREQLSRAKRLAQPTCDTAELAGGDGAPAALRREEDEEENAEAEASPGVPPAKATAPTGVLLGREPVVRSVLPLADGEVADYPARAQAAKVPPACGDVDVGPPEGHLLRGGSGVSGITLRPRGVCWPDDLTTSADEDLETEKPAKRCALALAAPTPSGGVAPASTAADHPLDGAAAAADLSGDLAEVHSTAVAKGAAAMCARRRREVMQYRTPPRERRDRQEELTEAPNVSELLPFWKEMRVLSMSMLPSRMALLHSSKPRHPTSRAGSQKFRDMLTTSPASKGRIIWETLGALFIIGDLVMIPLQAFHSNFDQLPVPLVIGKAAYWTCDIPLTFFVGFYVNGVLEVRFSKTAKRYLRTWFFVDLCLVTLDWILVYFQVRLEESESSEHLAILRAGRVLRLLRFARLLRLLKLHAFFSKLLESIHSEYCLTLVHVFEVVVVIIIVNHFIACLWYAIGTLEFDVTSGSLEKHWVSKFDTSDGFAYRYTTSMHWSITQFTPASMEVVPRNAVERTYNIIVVIMGMVTFSTFISSITAAMTHLRKIAGSKEAQFRQLRRYLGENNCSMQLAMRIWRYFEQGSKVRPHRMMWSDVVLFADIPDMLQMDLQYEVYMPSLTRHPFFFQLQEHNSVAMRAFCHTAVRELSFRSEQDVFTDGQAVDRMYFLIDGVLEYRMRCGVSRSPLSPRTEDSCSFEDVLSGQWLSEAAVWVKWFHMGTTVAKQFSVVNVLSVPALHQTMKEYVDLLPFCVAYAEHFVQILRQQGVSMSDLPLEFDKLQDMAHLAFESADGGDLAAVTPDRSRKTVKAGLMRGWSRLSNSHYMARPRRRRVTWTQWLHPADRKNRSGSGSGLDGGSAEWQRHGTPDGHQSGQSDSRRGSISGSDLIVSVDSQPQYDGSFSASSLGSARAGAPRACTPGPNMGLGGLIDSRGAPDSARTGVHG